MLKELLCKIHSSNVSQVCSIHIQQLCDSCKPDHSNCLLIPLKSFEEMVIQKINQFQKNILEFKKSFNNEMKQASEKSSPRSIDTKLSRFSQKMKKIFDAEVKSESDKARLLSSKLLSDCDSYLETLEKNKNNINIEDLSKTLSPDLINNLNVVRNNIFSEKNGSNSKLKPSLAECFLDKAMQVVDRIFELSENLSKSTLTRRDNTSEIINKIFSDCQNKPSPSRDLTPIHKIILQMKKKTGTVINSSSHTNSFILSQYRPTDEKKPNESFYAESIVRPARVNNFEIKASTYNQVNFESLVFENSVKNNEKSIIEEDFEIENLSSFEDDHLEGNMTEKVNLRVREDFERAKSGFKYLMRSVTDDLHSQDFFDLLHQKQIVAYLNFFNMKINERVKELIVSFAKL